MTRGLKAGDEIIQMQGRGKIVVTEGGTITLYTRPTAADGWTLLKTITPAGAELQKLLKVFAEQQAAVPVKTGTWL